METLIQSHSTTITEYGLIYRIFQWFSIIRPKLDTFRKKIKSLLILGCAVLVNFDLVALSLSNVLKFKSDFAILLSYAFSHISNFAIFSMLLYKGERFVKLLKTVFLISEVKTFKTFDVGVFLIFAVQMASVIAIFTSIILRNPTRFDIIIFGVTSASTLKYFLGFLQILFSTFFTLTFINLVSLLYCDLCHRCIASLMRLKSRVKSCPLDAFQENFQIGIIKRRGEIENAIKFIQKEFSLISLLICCTEILNCFALLSQLIYLKKTISMPEIWCKFSIY